MRQLLSCLFIILFAFSLAGCSSNVKVETDKAEGHKKTTKKIAGIINVQELTIQAEKGDKQAQYNLGALYAKGAGVTQDYTMAHKWWLKSAEQGDASAQYNLGTLYAKGAGTSQSFTEAHKWWLKAAKQGEAEAQYTIGETYVRGDGVSKDLGKAQEWFLKAAEQGQKDAQYNLGALHSYSKDYTSAREWLLKAANQGQKEAQYDLGLLYVLGHGVPKNHVEAYKWFSIATAHKEAELATTKMTPEQVAEAKKLTKEWLDAHPN